jgi:hypothetical protein
MEGNEWYGVFTVLDPGSRAFFTPEISDPDPRSGSEMEKKSGSGKRIRDKLLGSLVKKFSGLIQFCGSGMEKSRCGIRDKHPGTATLFNNVTTVE